MGCGRRGTEASEQPDGARAAGKKACKHDEPPALSSAESLKLEPVRLIVYKQRGDCRSVRCVFAQICRAVLPKSRGRVAEATFSAIQPPRSPRSPAKVLVCARKTGSGGIAPTESKMLRDDRG